MMTSKERMMAAVNREKPDRLPVTSAPHPKEEIWIDLGEKLEPGWLLRRKEDV